MLPPILFYKIIVYYISRLHLSTLTDLCCGCSALPRVFHASSCGVHSPDATRAAANGGKKAAEEEFKEEEKVAEEDEVKKATSSMRIDEAWKVMGLESTATAEDIRDRYKHLFHVTDKENGGSFYIQSKVVMAKEAVDLEIDPLPLDDDADEDEGKDTEMEGRDEKVGDDNDGDDGSDKGKKEKKETKKDWAYSMINNH